MAIDVSAVARVLGVEPVFKDLRGDAALFVPQRIYLVGQGNTAAQSTYLNEKVVVFSAAEVGARFGYGSPLHLAAKQYFPANNDGIGTIPLTIFPLDDGPSAVAATGDITPSGSASEAAAFRVRIGNILSEPFVVPAGAVDAGAVIDSMVTAISAVLDMPMLATDGTTVLNLAAKWAGISGNALKVSVEGPSVGVSFAVTQPSGGLVNPDVAPAIAAMGNIWYTLVHNCLDIADTTALAAWQAEGERRWGETVRKPFRCYTGVTEAAVASATAISAARTTDRVNGQLVAPGSVDLPFVVAARQVARIARRANNQPGRLYSGLTADGLSPGTDAEQWTFEQRDAAMKAGSSTVEIVDGQVELSNVITFWAPTGEPIPAFRFDADIVKLSNVIFNLDVEFSKEDWQGAILVPDGSPAVQSYIKQPKQAVAAVATVLDALELAGQISDAAAAKKTIVATIDSQNPKRLNVSVTVQLSGNVNVTAVTLNFGFYFGSPALAA